MPSADQVPVNSPHSIDALAHVGCPDRRIDRLVYDLYDLTGEEIAIVEKD